MHLAVDGGWCCDMISDTRYKTSGRIAMLGQFCSIAMQGGGRSINWLVWGMEWKKGREC